MIPLPHPFQQTPSLRRRDGLAELNLMARYQRATGCRAGSYRPPPTFSSWALLQKIAKDAKEKTGYLRFEFASVLCYLCDLLLIFADDLVPSEVQTRNAAQHVFYAKPSANLSYLATAKFDYARVTGSECTLRLVILRFGKRSGFREFFSVRCTVL